MPTTSKSINKIEAEWRVNTAQMLQETLENGGSAVTIMKIPFNIFKQILVMVGIRASQLNDPALNALMCRLAIYGESDPFSPDFNKEILDSCLAHPEYKKWKQDISAHLLEA
jgi:hypothetical protein